jgi:hypothetical protein
LPPGRGQITESSKPGEDQHRTTKYELAYHAKTAEEEEFTFYENEKAKKSAPHLTSTPAAAASAPGREGSAQIDRVEEPEGQRVALGLELSR